jgi:hypothetical protein
MFRSRYDMVYTEAMTITRTEAGAVVDLDADEAATLRGLLGVHQPGPTRLVIDGKKLLEGIVTP